MMTREEMQERLDEELAKSPEEMDTALVEKLLKELEGDVPEGAQEKALGALRTELRRQKAAPAIRWTTRIAATLVVLLGICVVTYKTAEAFNWELLLRLMRPFAETFMLYTGEKPPKPLDVEAALYADCLKTGQPQQYASLEEAPETLYGYPMRPQGMPERMTFLQGSAFSDDLNTTVTHVFMGEQGMCIFSVMILADAEQTTSFQYEKVTEEGSETYIAGCRLVYYTNSDNATMSVSWTRDSAQYSIFGDLTEAEVEHVVEQTMTMK